ncbi:MAG: SAM-dependent methyltransferase [Actinomycetota bacterium]|nr:SAM-dependent methyltransferase [Actinomycetota bacterium]
MPRRPDDVRSWLREQPPLDELRAAYPAEWEAVEREIRQIVASGEFDALRTIVATVSRPTASRRARSKQEQDALVSAEIRRQMAAAALRQHRVALATGVDDGKARFNLVNGWALQRLLFARALERKPVSMFWFRLIWPLVWQRRFLMALVQPKGIYCFYSKQLIEELAAIIGDASCLEIAAGDGTLSRFLADNGVRITATDDYSWKDRVTFPDTVTRQDARKALGARQPEVVICSWPPAGNAFERDVFKTRSVQLYIVISSRHEFSAGNWDAYRGQSTFEFTEDPALSRLVLPPELEPAVYVFRRSTHGG